MKLEDINWLNVGALTVLLVVLAVWLHTYLSTHS